MKLKPAAGPVADPITNDWITGEIDTDLLDFDRKIAVLRMLGDGELIEVVPEPEPAKVKKRNIEE